VVGKTWTDRFLKSLSTLHEIKIKKDRRMIFKFSVNLANTSTLFAIMHQEELIKKSLNTQATSCLMKMIFSAFLTVPEPSLLKVIKTSSKASFENTSRPDKFPSVSFTNFFVSFCSRASEFSTSIDTLLGKWNLW